VGTAQHHSPGHQGGLQVRGQDRGQEKEGCSCHRGDTGQEGSKDNKGHRAGKGSVGAWQACRCASATSGGFGRGAYPTSPNVAGSGSIGSRRGDLTFGIDRHAITNLAEKQEEGSSPREVQDCSHSSEGGRGGTAHRLSHR
jgi:hypothetical protein